MNTPFRGHISFLAFALCLPAFAVAQVQLSSTVVRICEPPSSSATKHWTPSPTDVRTLEGALPGYLASRARKRLESPAPEVTYGRQYYGEERNGRRFIVALFFPEEFAVGMTRFEGCVEVSDGGTSVWRTEFDVKTKRFRWLGVNGVA